MDSTEPLELMVVRPTLGQGGADRVTATLLRELPRNRLEPELVLLRAEGPFVDALPPDVPVTELAAKSLWTAWLPFLALVRRRRPAIVFSTSSGSNPMACLARLVHRRCRIVLSERSLLFRRRRRGLRIALWLAKRTLYPLADRVTAVSDGVRDDLLERLGLPPEKVTVVGNPVVTAELLAGAAEPIDDPWLDGPDPVVVAAGRLLPEKGFDTLLDAIALVRAHRPVRLLVLGEGPERFRLERRVDALGLSGAVRLPGFVDNPFPYFGGATLFVQSSRGEGLPGVLIQAMACGAPVVATDCPGGTAEVVADGSCGRLVPVDDPDALAEAIAELLDDAPGRRRLAAAGRRAVERFSVERSLAHYLEALIPTATRAEAEAESATGSGPAT